MKQVVYVAALASLLGLHAEVHADVLSVEADGSGDFPTIQQAIESVAPGDTIVLGDGVFRGDGNRDLTFGGKPIYLVSRSGEPQLCTLDTEGTPGEAHRGFHFQHEDGAGQVVRGIAISGGYVHDGGAAYCSFQAAPRFIDCEFRGNTATASGGAVFCQYGSMPVFENCEFVRNSADTGGAISLLSGSGGELAGCTLDENIAGTHGGGLYVDGGGELTIDASTLRSNTAGQAGGGILLRNGSSARIEGCTFTMNRAAYGGGLRCWVDCSPEVTVSVFTENHASYGGALMATENSGPTFRDCTFWRNSADANGGAILADGDLRTVHLLGCTISENSAVEGGGLWLHASATAVVDHCVISFCPQGEAVRFSGWWDVPAISCTDIYGNAGGDWIDDLAEQLGIDGNLASDPLYCGGEFPLAVELRADSPCAPEQSIECGLIGAWPVGCDVPTPTLRITWGGLRGRFR